MFCVFGSLGLIELEVMVLKIVVEIGYLVIIKVIVGGGGRGMCFV